KRYNTTVDQIRTTNQLKTDMLSIGSKLRIPQGMTPQQVDNTVPEQTPKQEVPTLEISTYRVVSGDTLYGISVKFGTTVDQLKSLNNLTTNVLSVGQVLKIPGMGAAPTTPAPNQNVDAAPVPDPNVY